MGDDGNDEWKNRLYRKLSDEYATRKSDLVKRDATLSLYLAITTFDRIPIAN